MMQFQRADSVTLFASGGAALGRNTEGRNAIADPLPLTLIKMEHVQEIKPPHSPIVMRWYPSRRCLPGDQMK